MVQLSQADKNKILSWKQQNVSQAVMAERIGCSRKTVNMFIRRWQLTGSTSRKEGSGRPSNEVKKKMKKLSPSKNKIEELQEIIKELQEQNNDLQKENQKLKKEIKKAKEEKEELKKKKNKPERRIKSLPDKTEDKEKVKVVKVFRAKTVWRKHEEKMEIMKAHNIQKPTATLVKKDLQSRIDQEDDMMKKERRVRFNSEVFSYSPTSSHSDVSESLK